MGARGEATQAAILAVLKAHDAPLSAYDVLGVLREDNPKAAPPTVYRALAALTAKGAVHRLESLNAYMACQHDSHAQDAILSICDDCGHVEESVAPQLVKDLAQVTEKSGFRAARHILEVHGICASCDDQEAKP